MDYSAFKGISIDVRANGVAKVTLLAKSDQPTSVPIQHKEIGIVWRTLEADDDVRSVLVTGTDDEFYLSGHPAGLRGDDNPETVKPTDPVPPRSWAATLRSQDDLPQIVAEMTNFSKPVVAAINGTVSGAGLAVALMSDITIAADNAVIFDPHIMLGMATGDGPGGLWPLFTGLPKAKLYLMTSDGLTGAEADRIGLISRAVPLADLQDVAEDYAERLASKATTYSVRLTKRALGQYLKLASLVCNDYSIAVQLLSFYSDERAREPLTPFPPRIVP